MMFTAASAIKVGMIEAEPGSWASRPLRIIGRPLMGNSMTDSPVLLVSRKARTASMASALIRYEGLSAGWRMSQFSAPPP
jgi:hypothetical protein